MMMSSRMTWTHGMCATCQWVLDPQILKFHLECDMCHPSDWAMSQMLVFHHMALCLSMVSGPTLALITIHQDQCPGGIAGTQVARELIPQG
jgi:hypothetical protein